MMFSENENLTDLQVIWLVSYLMEVERFLGIVNVMPGNFDDKEVYEEAIDLKRGLMYSTDSFLDDFTERSQKIVDKMEESKAYAKENPSSPIRKAVKDGQT